jgi:hypothetical protein
MRREKQAINKTVNHASPHVPTTQTTNNIIFNEKLLVSEKVLLIIVKGIGPCARICKEVSIYMYAFLIMLSGGFLGETVLEKIEEIGRKIDELRDFLEDVFLTTEECILLKEVDDIVKKKRFGELKSLDEV